MLHGRKCFMRQKPKFEDGSLTRMAGKEIGKLEEYISEEGLPERKYFEELEPGALFREGIDGWLCKLGYDSSMDDPKKKVAFLQAQFEKNGVAPVSSATLTNWLTRVDKNGTNRTGKIFSGSALHWKWTVWTRLSSC